VDGPSCLWQVHERSDGMLGEMRNNYLSNLEGIRNRNSHALHRVAGFPRGETHSWGNILLEQLVFGTASYGDFHAFLPSDHFAGCLPLLRHHWWVTPQQRNETHMDAFEAHIPRIFWLPVTAPVKHPPRTRPAARPLAAMNPEIKTDTWLPIWEVSGSRGIQYILCFPSIVTVGKLSFLLNTHPKVYIYIYG
jgi:hypothetical protein